MNKALLTVLVGVFLMSALSPQHSPTNRSRVNLRSGEAFGASDSRAREQPFDCAVSHEQLQPISLLSASEVDEIDVKLPDGFQITQVATDQLATDIFSMTLDARNRPVVSGPGYIRTLLDEDNDGIIDSYLQFADGPKNGAQGLLCLDEELLCTGDGGLLRYVDRDRDGVADGPPELLLKLKTGGEHMAHAIRIGLDGNFYLLAGNQTGIPDASRNSSLRDEVEFPHAGFLLRISPDFQHRDIVASGFRNAYDFDFNLDGDLIVYDSDGERDISLPWYRPTRVFRMRPGDDAGWMTEGWKRPSWYFDMPETLAETGRGSPTGVCNFVSESFGTEFLEAVFVADWTFGRIRVIKRNPTTGDYLPVEDFAIADGTFGFAVTDLVADIKNGALLVSVGGRGTQGGVYRIERTGPVPTDNFPIEFARLGDMIYSSLTKGPPNAILVRRAISEGESDRVVNAMVAQAARDSIPPDLLSLICERMTVGDARTQRAMLTQLIGRRFNAENGTSWLENDDVRAVQLAEALVAVAGSIAGVKSWRDMDLWTRVCRTLPDNVLELIRQEKIPVIAQTALEVEMFDSFGKEITRDQREEFVGRLIEQLGESGSDQRGVWLRLIQKSLGPYSGEADFPGAVFHGYSGSTPKCKFDPATADRLCASLANAYKQIRDNGTDEEHYDLLRVIAKSRLYSAELLALIVADLDSNLAVPDAVHRLAVIAVSGVELEKPKSVVVAGTIAGLRSRLKTQDLNEDRNWVPRVGEICRVLSQQPAIALAVVGDERFPKVGNEYLLDLLPPAIQENAREKIVAFMIDAPPESVSSAHIKLLKYFPEHRDWLRKKCSESRFRQQAIRTLAATASSDEVPLLVDALEYGDLTTVQTVASRLLRIANEGDPGRELVLAWRAATRLGKTEPEMRTRDLLVQLISMRTGTQFDYTPGKKDDVQSEPVGAIGRWLAQNYPSEFERLVGDSQKKIAELVDRITNVNWNSGDAIRGETIYAETSCIKCHGGGSRMGPSLEGVTRRFSNEDLFRAIVLPDAQVSERYKSVVVSTHDGFIHRGIVIYESVDGITLGDTQGETVRINQVDIDQRADSELSAMPAGLIDELSGQDWSDLYAYLKTL